MLAKRRSMQGLAKLIQGWCYRLLFPEIYIVDYKNYSSALLYQRRFTACVIFLSFHTLSSDECISGKPDYFRIAASFLKPYVHIRQYSYIMFNYFIIFWLFIKLTDRVILYISIYLFKTIKLS